MFLMSSTLSGKGIMPCLVILNPRYSGTFLAEMDFSAFFLSSSMSIEFMHSKLSSSYLNLFCSYVRRKSYLGNYDRK